MRHDIPRWVGAAAGVACLAALLTLAGCGERSGPWPQKPGPKVLASFAPIYCFAINVAGDDASVLPLMTGQGPHGFEGSPKDALKLRKADLLFLNGLGLDERVAERLRTSSGNASLKLIELGEAIPANQLVKVRPADEDHGHSHGPGADPHVWLGIPEAKKMVETIRDELKAIDPAHADGYDRRSAAYVAKLDGLLTDGREKLKGKTDRPILSFHESLTYFARCVGLTVADYIEVEPGTEPGADKLKKLIALCEKERIRVIAVEPQFPTNTAAGVILEALKKSPKVKDPVFVEVDPMETADEKDLTPDYYERTFRANVDHLAKALP